jgi:hypothetical protein
MKKPGDPEPEPSGGRAAKRMREFLEQRLPQNVEPAGEEQPQPAGDAAKPPPAGGDAGDSSSE